MSTVPPSQNIRVLVRSEYISAQSSTEEQRFVFAYHVTIENRGSTAAKLLSRHWIITDGDQHVQEVKGDGVIGQQPTIEPGDSYKYSSGAVIKTPVGTMQGSYQMIDEISGSAFNANIPVFRLASPNAIN